MLLVIWLRLSSILFQSLIQIVPSSFRLNGKNGAAAEGREGRKRERRASFGKTNFVKDSDHFAWKFQPGGEREREMGVPVIFVTCGSVLSHNNLVNNLIYYTNVS